MAELSAEQIKLLAGEALYDAIEALRRYTTASGNWLNDREYRPVPWVRWGCGGGQGVWAARGDCERRPRGGSPLSDTAERLQEAPPTKCQWCDGEGWYVGHEDECYEDGCCSCSGVQVQCECGLPPNDPSIGEEIQF